ncbi:peptidoglycan-binding protein [Lusitaniella coriacea LEGE 07157]|uniref:Peptidoglycan-binding protein n=1 Tax=Lusitaniella coriacea LEGE 07157 TaxID=945747 RepID=A0A8J7DU53_9CYAN|nr:peptidoglycan-binding protein [Lusitaniella coriacea]MBE9115086.1 peptidoglycan-binding protein [Lusitaniella coriacea LEGE 07157]
MESVAYLHLCLAYESPTRSRKRIVKRSVKKPSRSRDRELNIWEWLKKSLRGTSLQLTLLSLTVILGIFTTAGGAMAQRFGESSEEVTRIQMRLQVLGYSYVLPTGVYDAKTEEAIEDFQRQQGLNADGVVGRQTRPLLFSGVDPDFNTTSTVARNIPAFSPEGTQKRAIPVSTNLARSFPPEGTNTNISNTSSRSQFPPEGTVSKFSPRSRPPQQVAQISNFDLFYPGLTLRNGDRSEAVRVLQQTLRRSNVYFGPNNGNFGSQTEEAVRLFQSISGLQVDGVVGDQTLRALGLLSSSSPRFPSNPPPFTPSQTFAQSGNTSGNFSGRTLRRGDRGGDVRRLQVELNRKGYDTGGIDGIYGLATENAVRAFQFSQRLRSDGIAGSQTLTALGIDPGRPGSEDRRYVVVVPGDNEKLTEVRRYVSNARLGEAKRGGFVNAGQFADRESAEARSYQLRSYGLDARVAYF